MAEKNRISQVQKEKDPVISRLGIWIFAILLKLYPKDFYSTFSDEMLEVFVMKLSDSYNESPSTLMKSLLTEAAEIPVALIAQHIYKRKRQAMRLLRYDTTLEINLARWIARGISILIVGFVLLLLALNDDFRSDPTLPTVVLWIIALCLVIAWRWERIGGLLVIFLSPIFVLSIVIQWSGAKGLIALGWQLAFIGIVMALSFAIIGWLFVSVAWHSEVTRTPDGGSGTSQSPSRRWTYLIIILLGLLAVAFFVVPMGIPVQQQIEYADDSTMDMEYSEVVDRLRERKALVGVGSATFERPPFSVSGSELNVNGGIVQVFKYADVASATADAVMISDMADAGWQGISWNESPHIFQAGNNIILYTGGDEELLTLLTSAFGTPFIGG
ncbi:MAG: hypothetical protein WA996_17340 [Candidatus Promineifilaceae bacterium]